MTRLFLAVFLILVLMVLTIIPGCGGSGESTGGGPIPTNPNSGNFWQKVYTIISFAFVQEQDVRLTFGEQLLGVKIANAQAPKKYMRAIFFLKDGKKGSAVGDDGVVVSTTNGGHSQGDWSETKLTPGVDLRSIKTDLDEKISLIGGGNDLFNPKVLRSTDFSNWSEIPSGNMSGRNKKGYVYCISMSDENNGWLGTESCVGRITNGQNIFFTARTMTNVDEDNPHLYKVYGIYSFPNNPNKVVFATISGLYMTIDGLATEASLKVTDSFKYVTFFDNLNGWAGGDRLYCTSNGGDNWTQVYSFPTTQRDITAESDKKITVTGDNGAIYSSQNGGISFTADTSGVSDTVSGVFYTPNRGKVAVGRTEILQAP